MVKSVRLDCRADDYATIGQSLEEHGYAVFKGDVTSDDDILALSEHFGRVQRHMLSNKDGVVEISTNTQSNQKIKNADEYGGLSAKSFPLHTDGAFLQGLAELDDRTAFELRPPRLIVMSCTLQASEGGGNVLVDGADLYRALADSAPKFLDAISKPGSAVFVRDTEQSARSEVFEMCADGTYQVRYRGDRQMYFGARVSEDVSSLHDIIAERVPKVLATLEEGDIIVVDNTRILHSRENATPRSLTEPRTMRRLWVFDDRSEQYFNGPALAGRASMEAYNEYRPMERSSEQIVPYLRLGVRP